MSFKKRNFFRGADFLSEEKREIETDPKATAKTGSRDFKIFRYLIG
jgi:hypothetical protein